MAAVLSELLFPVVLVPKARGERKTFNPDIDLFVRCTSLALKRGYFTGAEIIDSSGKKFIVTEARRGPVTKHWWQRPTLVTYYKADLALNFVGSVNPDEMKNLFLSSIVASAYNLEMPNFKEFSTRLKNCSAVEECSALLIPLRDLSPLKKREH